MAILEINNSITGLSGVIPNFAFIQTSDTLATVTTAGYLTDAVKEGTLILNTSTVNGVIQPNTFAFVSTSDSGSVILMITVTGVPGNFVYSLTAPMAAAPVIVAGNIQAGINGTAGAFISYPAGLNDGFLNLHASNSAGGFNTIITNAAMGQTTTFTIPDPGVAAANFLLTQNAGTQTIATGSLALTLGSVTATAGNFIAGNHAGPAAGNFQSFPAVSGGANDKLVIAAVTTGGNFTTTVSNGAMGQSSVVTIPDPGAATANFLLSSGAQNTVTDYQQMLGINDFSLASGGGAFTLTRAAQGDWSWVHTVAADTSVLGFDITEQLRAAAGRGFELVSFDVIYSIGTLALVAHSVTLATTVYANNVATAVTNVAITGALATATQANPYVTNVTVNVPAFNNPAASTALKQVIEVSVQAAATSVYSVKGINLRFSKTIL
jgi:hypothetical protein